MNSRNDVIRPLRLDIIHTVLEGALDAGATEYVAACRRLLRANLRGWRSHADPDDWKAVLEASEEMRDDD